MSEESYCLIDIADHTHAPKRRVGDGHYLEYYPDGGVAETVFTDRERARALRGPSMRRGAYRVASGAGRTRSELNHAMSISGPKKTHVLLDPEYGNEENSLRSLDRQ